MTEEDYRNLLAMLGFDMERHKGPDNPAGQALRHTTLRFPDVPYRVEADTTIFWPTLYWNRTVAGLIYFAAARRDVEHFLPHFWVPLSSDMVKDIDAGISFVPVNKPGIGAREALQSLINIRRN